MHMHSVHSIFAVNYMRLDTYVYMNDNDEPLVKDTAPIDTQPSKDVYLVYPDNDELAQPYSQH